MNNEYYNVNSSAVCTSVRWLTEEVFKLIDIVQKDEAIYNPRHKYYFCRPYVENFWREVDSKLEKNPGASLAKWTNLRISFRREYTNYLEEKLPPCWTYFDRMFFLHPFLRKKHPQAKTIEPHRPDALVQINSLANRLQHDLIESQISNSKSLHHKALTSQKSILKSQMSPEHIDKYLEYFENTDQNISEIDETIENEQNERFSNVDNQSINNDIKSECEDGNEEYEETIGEGLNYSYEDAENEALNFSWDSSHINPGNHNKSVKNENRNSKMCSQYLQRIKARCYHEERRNKRLRSNESISSTFSCQNTGMISSQRLMLSNNHAPGQSNVSFVRPTFNKSIDVVSTTTVSNNQGHNSDGELTSTTIQSSSTTPNIQPRHTSHIQHSDNQSINSKMQCSSNATYSSITSSVVPGTANQIELCDCKSDPDAMFLMSLLPDIQKLNGRDRGKIKIAFQNILQDYLYPD